MCFRLFCSTGPVLEKVLLVFSSQTNLSNWGFLLIFARASVLDCLLGLCSEATDNHVCLVISFCNGSQMCTVMT